MHMYDHTMTIIFETYHRFIVDHSTELFLFEVFKVKGELSYLGNFEKLDEILMIVVRRNEFDDMIIVILILVSSKY